MQSYSIGRAARLPGVSPDTARRWADAGRVVTPRDEGGRRLIAGRDLAAFSVEVGQGAHTGDGEPHTSARNAFPGIVTAVQLGDVTARVEIQAGPHRLSPCSPVRPSRSSGWRSGMQATARVNSTSVRIDRT